MTTDVFGALLHLPRIVYMQVKVKILYIGQGFLRVPQNLKKLPTQVRRLLSKRQIYVGDFFTFCGALKIC